MSTADVLLVLQSLDLEIDHLTRQIASPPELVPFEAARRTAEATGAALESAGSEQRQVEAEWTSTEAACAEIDRQVERLQKQLRTVVVVREAEALQHELVTLAQRRSELDDVGLVALDRLEALAAQRAEFEARLPGEQEAQAQARAALEAARAELRDRRERCVIDRAAQAALVPAAVLTRYEQLRQHLGGMGVAVLDGTRCTGCRLDVSRGELEQLRAAPADDLVECPNCGRLLVR